MTALQGRRNWSRTSGVCNLLALAILVLHGCTTIKPRQRPAESLDSACAKFSHPDVDVVLKQFVDANGLVDYRALQRNPDRFEQYYGSISRYSPDSHPQLFATDSLIGSMPIMPQQLQSFCATIRSAA